MRAYRARYESGRVVPIGEPVIPEGSEIILTILDFPMPNNPAERQHRALRRFREEIKGCNEPVPEFERVSLREVEL